MPLRSRSVRRRLRTSSSVKRCSVPALTRTAERRTCQRLRGGRAPAEGLAFSAMASRAGWSGRAGVARQRRGHARALMLGPLAVEASCREFGVGTALIDHALAAAKARGHRAVILLGDAPCTPGSASRRARAGRGRAAGPVRARPPARPGTGRRRARRRLRDDRADRREGYRCQAGAARPRGIAVTIMRKRSSTARAIAHLRYRSIVTTMLVMALSLLIVRDILVRRWGSTPPSSDVTRRLP